MSKHCKQCLLQSGTCQGKILLPWLRIERSEQELGIGKQKVKMRVENEENMGWE